MCFLSFWLCFFFFFLASIEWLCYFCDLSILTSVSFFLSLSLLCPTFFHFSTSPQDLWDCGTGGDDCYLVDFHIPLTKADGTRSLLGSVENDYEYGWQKGSFFMYEGLEVQTPQPCAAAKDHGNGFSCGGNAILNNELCDGTCTAVDFVDASSTCCKAPPQHCADSTHTCSEGLTNEADGTFEWSLRCL